MSKPPESIKVDIPKLPSVDFPLLNTERFCVGTAILSYLTNALRVPVSDEFSALCNQIDEIRDQMCAQKELSPKNVNLYIDYFTLLPGLKEHLDVTNRGLNFQFKWESVIFNIVEADLVFFGYNAIISLLKCASRIVFKSKSDVQSLIDCLKPSKAIYDRILPLYQEGFKIIIALQKIQALPHYIDAYWSYGFLNNTMIANASFVMQGKVSHKFSKQLNLFVPPQSDLSTYFEVFALAKMFEGYQKENVKDVSIEEKFGYAIAFGNQAIELCPKPKQEKKRGSSSPSPLQILLQPLLQQLQASVDALVTQNKSIYHQKIPPKVEIPEFDLPPLPPFKWESNVKPVSFDSDVSQVASSQIQSKVNEIRQRISDAISKISQIRSLYPREEEAEIDEKTSTLYAKRTLCLEEEKKLSALLQGRAGALHPELRAQFNQLQSFIPKAANTDLFYETILATAKSEIQALSVLISQLDPIQAQIQQLQQSFEFVAQQSMQVLDSTDISQVIAANQSFSQNYDNSQAQLSVLTQQIDGIQAQAMNISQGNLQQFSADLKKVAEGFNKGIKCYSDLIANFSVITSRLMA